MAENRWNIYVLKDPRSNQVLYVGRTKNPKMRLAAHISDATKAKRKNTHKNNRLRQIIAEGITPILEIVETGIGDSAEAECRWIATMRSEGINLLNSTDGGEGVPGLRRAPRTPEHTAKYRAAMKNIIETADYRAKLSAALKGYNRTPRIPEHCQALAAALTGNTLSSETRARISAAMTGKTLSEEHRMRISATKTTSWSRSLSRRKRLWNSGFNWNRIKQQWNT